MTMTLDEVRNVVLLFSNPTWSGIGSVPSTTYRNITALSSEIAYSADFTENITVLTSRFAETSDGVIQGLLYVPDLDPTDPCASDAAKYVPSTAVRQANLPPMMTYKLIALAPWISVGCARSYLLSAQTDPQRGFIFYIPSNSTAAPPSASSEVWDLDDGGAWKLKNDFPVYAIPGAMGSQMMYQLSLYSGSVDQVPNSENISSLYDPQPDDYVRIWTELTVSTKSNFPIWGVVLIVVGVFAVVTLSTSILMHWVQARRRASLRRRVIRGEVNLEGMGIKRLTVPMNYIQTFPLFTYHYEPEDNNNNSSSPSSPLSPTVPQSPRPAKTRRDSRDPSETLVASPVTTARPATFSEKGFSSPFPASTIATDYQPMCAICLEAYQNRVTVIRELPCGHIFHPECIDEFLNENSSLCPLCKTCMLPAGYCPRITNAMVRRERAIRRLRDLVIVEYSDEESPHGGARVWSRLGSVVKGRIFGGGLGLGLGQPHMSTEMQPRGRRRIVTVQAPHPQPRSLPSGRRENGHGGGGGTNTTTTTTQLARQRMREFAGSEPYDEESGMTRWQWIRNKIFPGF